MGRIRRGLQRATEVIARRVARDELFERRGERVPPPPLPPRPPAAVPAAAASVAVPAAAAPAAAVPAAAGPLQAGLARAAGLDAVRAALGPTGRPRIVNHWATWCAPCVEELPHLVALAARLPPGVELLGLSWDLFDPRGPVPEVVASVDAFSQAHGITWPSLVATCEPEALFGALAIGWEKIPQTWVLDGQGEVLRRVEGLVDAALCDELLALAGGA